MTQKKELSLYERIKLQPEFNEEVHCESIIRVLTLGNSVTDFLQLHGISKQRFVSWQMKHQIFKECFMIAKDIGKKKWLEVGQANIDNKEFNFKIWAIIGRQNYGGLDTVSLSIDPTSTPFEQYQQIMLQATCGDFTASEIKQIMESINIGIRAYESCELEEKIQELQEGLQKMEERELEYQIASETAPKKDKATLDS